MSRSEYLLRVDSLAAVLLALDSDVVDLGRSEAKAVARHVVRSDWFEAQLAEAPAVSDAETFIQ